MHPTPPPRLHALLASRSARALVLRRGPGRSVASILWDRRRDTFEVGQWMRARIDEHRCDVSPDGRHWIYFCVDGRWEGEAQGAWTAVARTPYLKALALYPKGDTWQGGGLWNEHGAFWVQGFEHHDVLHTTSEVQRATKYALPLDIDTGRLGILVPRLLRDGWILRGRGNLPESEAHFDKVLRPGWVLRRTLHVDEAPPQGRASHWDEHVVLDPRGEVAAGGTAWEWADWDAHRRRLVWAEAGRIRTAELEPACLEAPTELFDARPLEFEPVPAPY